MLKKKANKGIWEKNKKGLKWLTKENEKNCRTPSARNDAVKGVQILAALVNYGDVEIMSIRILAIPQTTTKKYTWCNIYTRTKHQLENYYYKLFFDKFIK